MNEKVYCKDCKHFGSKPVTILDSCDAPENIIANYYAPDGNRKKIPSEQNSKNDCKWFKEKGMIEPDKPWPRRVQQ